MTTTDIGLLFIVVAVVLAAQAWVLWRLWGDVSYLLWVHSDPDLHREDAP